MKKALFLIILASLAAASYAQPVVNRDIFIDGDAPDFQMLEFFYVNFGLEAVGAGYTVVTRPEDAGFIFKFEVTENPYKETDGNQYDLKISLINNNDKKPKDPEILSFHFYFDNLDQMYEHNQFLFLRAASVIPPLNETAILKNDTAWKNKRLYFRASFDYPISFYELQKDGLVGDIGVYDGDYDAPDRVSDMDHKIIVLPGFTVGAEFQFLDFISLELNFRGYFGDFKDNYFFNMAAGAQLKFPIKVFKPFVISPYIGGMFFIQPSELLSRNVSSGQTKVIDPETGKQKDIYIDVFRAYPNYALGGGIQLSAKGGRNGAFFVDANYMFTLTGQLAHRNNPYGELFPKPEVIKYRPYYVGISIGYKFGVINRPEKSCEQDTQIIIIIPGQEEAESESEPEKPAPPPVRPARRRQTFYF